MPVSRYRYLHLDVFTDRRFGGNQLAVFPAADGLSTALMQQIAKEIGFAETTFVTRSERDDTDVRMRIFTPAVEMPMAGHPVVGSTFALAREGRIGRRMDRWVFGLNVGPTPVDLEWNDQFLRFARMTQKLPEFGPFFDPADVAPALGIPEQAIRATKLPVHQISCGVPFVMVPVATRADVDAAAPDARAFGELAAKGDHAHFSVYLFTTDRGAARDNADVYTRMFAPGLGVYEDPATGSAAGPLGCYLVKHSVVSPEQASAVVNLQGAKLGRPSWIHISIGAADGAITRVCVGGSSVFVAEGMMDVEEDGHGAD